MATKRDIQIRKLLRLRKETLELQQKLYPNSYAFTSYTHLEEPYIQFANNMVYPVKAVEMYLKQLKKEDFKEGHYTVGLTLEIPTNYFKGVKSPKKKKSAVAKPKRAKKAQKSTHTNKKVKNNAKTKPNKRSSSRPKRNAKKKNR